MTIHKTFAHGLDMNEGDFDPLGIELFEEEMWNMPEALHPDEDWRDPEEMLAGKITPEEHPHFGKDAVEYEYRTWTDEYDNKFETLSIDEMLIFKVGPLPVGKTVYQYDATCEQIIEILEGIRDMAPEKTWYDSLGLRLEQVIQPGGLVDSENLYVDDRLMFKSKRTHAEARMDAPVVTCTKIFELIKQVFDNLHNKIPMTFRYVYEGKPRTGLFASNDFAA